MIRPPGGASTIFDEADAAAAASAANGERNVVTPERHVNYKMRSNFELGDEQPAPPPASAAQQQRRRSKPSGEWVGFSIQASLLLCTGGHFGSTMGEKTKVFFSSLLLRGENFRFF